MSSARRRWPSDHPALLDAGCNIVGPVAAPAPSTSGSSPRWRAPAASGERSPRPSWPLGPSCSTDFLRVDPDEVLRFQGYKKDIDVPSAEVRAIFDEALAEGERLMRP